MANPISSTTVKKLVFKMIEESVDIRKRSIYLQEIIDMSHKEPIWLKALTAYFDTTLNCFSVCNFSRN